MGKKGNPENTIRWVCKKCGCISPITEKKCVNPNCQADLTTYGQKVGKRSSVDTRKKVSKRLVAAIVICLLAGVVDVYFDRNALNGNTQQEEVKNSTENTTTNTDIVQEEVSEQTPVEDEEKWIDNILMEDNYGLGSYYEKPSAKVLGSEIIRQDIVSVTILDTLADAPADSWDVSKNQNGLVLAWVEKNGTKYDLYIAGEGGINAKNCNNLFAGYINAERIDLNGNFHTDYAEDMRSVFENCHSVKELDVSELNTERATNMYTMFAECKSLKTLDVSNFDTSNVTSMSAMFCKCEKLEVLDVSGFDTANVTGMSFMFVGCEALKELDVSNFNTSQVTSMYAMFRGCKNLNVLDVSGFDTAQVTNMACLFNDCSGLTQLDVSGFDTSEVTDMYAMFCGCTNLEALDVSNFNTENVTCMELMFYDCSGVDEADVANFDMRNVEEKDRMFT